MTHKVRDLLCSIIMLIFGIVMFVVALGIPHKVASDVGSGFVPKFISICIIVVAVVQGVLTLMDKSPALNSKAKDGMFEDMKGGIVTIVLMAAYMAIFEPVGFVFSSIIYLFLQILWLSDDTNRKPVLFAIISVVLPLAVSALFAFVIKMPLPKGIWGF